MRNAGWCAGVLILSLTASCGWPAMPTFHSPSVTAASLQGELSAQFVEAAHVPADVIRRTLVPAQKTADNASKRRGIDEFHLHDNPVAMRIGSGPDAAWVLSILGTSRQRSSLNLELRALVAGGQTGFSLNYSGSTTLGLAQADHRMPVMSEGLQTASKQLTFDLVQGLPGGTVTNQYGRYLDRLAEHLRQRYDARPFQFDDVPHIFAVNRGGSSVGFLFTNQGNRLMLGERKYADIQSVALFSPSGQRLCAYTLIGFNDKTVSPTSKPDYAILDDTTWGPLVEFGDIPGRRIASTAKAEGGTPASR